MFSHHPLELVERSSLLTKCRFGVFFLAESNWILLGLQRTVLDRVRADSTASHVLVYIASYYDYVRVRNHLHRLQVCILLHYHYSR